MKTADCGTAHRGIVFESQATDCRFTESLGEVSMKRLAVCLAGFLAFQVPAIAAPIGLYWTGTSTIEFANLDGSNPTILISGLTNPQDIFVTDDHLYWGDRDDEVIYRANTDGTNIETLLSTTPGDPRDVAVTTDHIYWAATGGMDSISRSNLDGSAATALVTDDLSFPNGIMVTDDFIYWSDSGKTSIKRSDLEGSDVTTLVSNLGEAFLPNDVFVASDYIYFPTRDLELTRGGTEFVPGTIQRANIDGTGLTILINDLVFPSSVVATSDFLYCHHFVARHPSSGSAY